MRAAKVPRRGPSRPELENARGVKVQRLSREQPGEQLAPEAFAGGESSARGATDGKTTNAEEEAPMWEKVQVGGVGDARGVAD